MNITLAKSAYFCFGVKRAITLALKAAASGAKVYMLGDIVHNEDVVKQIENSGIKRIRKLSSGKGKTLLIRAHGAALKTYRKARLLGYKIIDATCPMVKEIHNIVRKMEAKNYQIIVIGDQKHDEVMGIVGQLKKKAIIIDRQNSVLTRKISGIKKAVVVVQSTQNLDDVLRSIDLLKRHIPELEFFNTICNPTRLKQNEIKVLAAKNDLIIIIGSKNSANTKRLYEISKSINRNSQWINSKAEIKPKWFKQIKKVGITAGSSTPESTIKDIVNYIIFKSKIR